MGTQAGRGTSERQRGSPQGGAATLPNAQPTPPGRARGARARRNESELAPTLFDFLHKVLSADLVAKQGSGFRRHTVVRLAMRLQHYCSPVTAKGLEDTAFYRYNRLAALNEVGGNPAQFSLSVANFHKHLRGRAQRWPRNLLTTSTHDTKRGEDVRARLAVLAEFPDEWLQQVQAWSRIVRARQGDIEGRAPPEANEEYLLYQLLIGSWPVEMVEGQPLQSPALLEYSERIKAVMIKSIRESKVHSSWAMPNAAYESAVSTFIDSALDATLSATLSASFFDSFVPFVSRVARLGAHNTLVQTVLKLTAPGVPDFYQGAELWDLSLVDPDNRRPVAFDHRDSALREVQAELDADRTGAMSASADRWSTRSVRAYARFLPKCTTSRGSTARSGASTATSVFRRTSRRTRRTSTCGSGTVIGAAGAFPASSFASPTRR